MSEDCDLKSGERVGSTAAVDLLGEIGFKVLEETIF